METFIELTAETLDSFVEAGRVEIGDTRALARAST